MSIIGEIKDEEIYDLKQKHKVDLGKFAEWVAENNWKYDGVKLWSKMPDKAFKSNYTHSYLKPNIPLANTDQLVEQFLKENGQKGTNTAGGQGSLAELK